MTSSTPQTAKAANKGKSEEAPRFLPLETIEVHFLSDEKRPRIFGVVSNISETGACIITNREVAVESDVTLEIRSRRENKLLEESARVVWCAEGVEPVKEIAGYLTGVRFDREAQPRIKQLLTSGNFQPIP